MTLQHLLILVALLVPLSLDNFVLSAALGLAGLPANQRLRTSLTLAAFEAGMPVIGVLIGQGAGNFLGRFAGYTAAAVIGLAGLIALWPGKDEDKERQRLKLLAHARGLAIIDLGVSISIDELAIGFGLGLLHVPLILAIGFLAVQTFAASQFGLWAGGRLNETLQEGAERLAGVILVIVAIVLIVLRATGHEL